MGYIRGYNKKVAELIRQADPSCCLAKCISEHNPMLYLAKPSKKTKDLDCLLCH